MTKIFEATGKTVEEALDAVCALAGVGLDEGEVEVIDYASKGFLGIGSKEAKVRFIVPKNRLNSTETAEEEENIFQGLNHRSGQRPLEEKTDLEKKAKNKDASPKAVENVGHTSIIDDEVITTAKRDALTFLEPVFNYLKVFPETTTVYKEDVLWLSFSGKGLNVLIGRRGETLNALQYLVNLVCNKKNEGYTRIVLDVENYRQGRERTLTTLAKKMAEKAVRTERRVELEPMNPHERRVVHIALQNDKRVETLSRGDEPYRRIVIVKKTTRNKNNT